jgi:hypothetical protein
MVEMITKAILLVNEEISKSSLLDKVIFIVDSHVFHLLFGGSEEFSLDHFSCISPLGAHLLHFITRIHVVERSELGSHHECEMSDFTETNVPSDKELVMEDHTSNPFIMRPSSQSGN